MTVLLELKLNLLDNGLVELSVFLSLTFFAAMLVLHLFVPHLFLKLDSGPQLLLFLLLLLIDLLQKVLASIDILNLFFLFELGLPFALLYLKSQFLSLPFLVFYLFHLVKELLLLE